ncbi:MAG: thioredoxin domain-containing protein [Chloroflexi bacterium]|nr:thioredoxin domain-containing protein [Chloroflexota bacterium]
MSKNKPAQKRKSKRQMRQEAKVKQARQKRLRIGGVVFLALVIIVAIIFLQRGNTAEADALVAETEPNILGITDTPVKIVEFSDFGCPSCRAWHNSGMLEQLQADFGDQISFEFRHFPVITAQSPKAAEAAQCAAAQGAFWQYHDYVYEETPQAALSVNQLKSYATAVGLDQASFDNCLDSDKYESYVRRDWQAALDVGARGTPTFLINGQQASPTYQSMTATINNILNN